MTDRTPPPLLRLSTLALRLGGPGLHAPALSPARLALIRRRMADGHYELPEVVDAVARKVRSQE